MHDHRSLTRRAPLLLALVGLAVHGRIAEAQPKATMRGAMSDSSRLQGRELSVDRSLGAILEPADGDRRYRDRFRIPVSKSYPAAVVCDSGSGLVTGRELAALVDDQRVTQRKVQLESLRMESGFPELRFNVRGNVSGHAWALGLTVRLQVDQWLACLTDRDPRFASDFQAAEAKFLANVTWNKPPSHGSDLVLRAARAATTGPWLGFDFKREWSDGALRRVQYLRAFPAIGSDLEAWTPVLREEVIDSGGRLLQVKERRGREQSAELAWGKPNAHGQCTAMLDGLELVRPCLPARPIATTIGTESKLKRSLATGAGFRFEQLELRPELDRIAPIVVSYEHRAAGGPGAVSIRVQNQPARVFSFDANGQLVRERIDADVDVEWSAP